MVTQNQSPTLKGRAIPCPHCGKILEWRPEWRGKRMCCYSCKGIFVFRHKKIKKRPVMQDPLRVKLREILPDATESDLNRALQHIKKLKIDLQQLEYMETPRIRKLFRSDTPALADQCSLTRGWDIKDMPTLRRAKSNPSFHIENTQSPMHLEKKQNRNFIKKMKNVFRRKK